MANQSTLWTGFIVLVVLAAWLAVIGINQEDSSPAPTEPGSSGQAIVFGPKVDDWDYDPGQEFEESGQTLGLQSTFSSGRGVSVASDSAGPNLGFAVGGANDISNFRQNVASGFLPSPADISPEGIFYDYFFDTGQVSECQELFCPSYTTAVSPDPFSGNPQHFLSVGLNSNIKQEDFDRKDLDLVVVLDISGSMSGGLDDYYYDQFGQPVIRDGSDGPAENLTKMEAASQSLVALLDHLRPQDRLGIVLFDDQSYVAKPLGFIGEADLELLSGHILELAPRGGTSMEAGYISATGLFEGLDGDQPSGRESRIIFLTDAMPNTGNTSRTGLTQLAADNAQNDIYTSFIGIGVDFNADLISSITQTPGANYHAVHSTEDFKRRLDEGFEYMVTPLVFDLSLKLESDGYDIKAVYGSPEADLATGEIMKVNTLFPSLTVDGQTRGGLILLQLEKTADDAQLSLTVDYQDRAGGSHSNSQTVEFSSSDGFDNSGIHKGVVLSRLVNSLKDWLRYEPEIGTYTGPEPDSADVYYRRNGIPVILEPIPLGYWERTSRPLRLSGSYRPVLSTLRDYLSQEIEAIGDAEMEQELDLLDKILEAADS